MATLNTVRPDEQIDVLLGRRRVQDVPETAPDDALSSSTGHVGTDHLLQKLNVRVLSGGVVTGVTQALQFGLNVIAIGMLARLLTPPDFGLIAMASVIISFLAMFREAGLFTATIQKDGLTHQQVSNLFWANVALGLFACVLCSLLALPVAWFYRDTRLEAIVPVLSITFVLAGLTVQQEALLVRQMRFQARAYIQLGSLVFGFCVAALMALAGYGYWSLVWMQLCSAGGMLMLAWAASRWRPSLPRRDSGTESLLRFGAHLTVGTTIARVSLSSDTFLLGRLLGAEAVGLYSRGSVLLVRPLEQVLTPISAVLLPALSRLQDDPDRYRRLFTRAFDVVAMTCFPLTALLCALAEPFVLLVLGPRWRASAPLFEAFSLAGIYIPLAYAASWLLESQGRGRDVMRVNLYLGIVTPIVVIGGLFRGPVGVALGMSLAGLLVRMPSLFYVAGRSGPVSTAYLWRLSLRYVPLWAAVFGTAVATRLLLRDASPLTQILSCAPTSLIVGAIVAFAFKPSREAALLVLARVRAALSER